MVFIHGGGFLFGSSSPMTYSADYLMNYDVVLVTVNYRLHALGNQSPTNIRAKVFFLI